MCRTEAPGLTYGVATCEFEGCRAVFGVPLVLVAGGLALALLGHRRASRRHRFANRCKVAGDPSRRAWGTVWVMRLASSLIAFGLLAGCWHEQARPARPRSPDPIASRPLVVETPREPSSYRSTTIAADTIGVTVMAAGLIGLQRGRDEDTSGGLLVAGLATAAFVTPILHLAKGHKGRAGGSYLMRSLLSTTGTVVGYAAGCPGRPELSCGLTGMMWGVTGGLAIAGALDAILLHERPRTWMPTLTPGDGGARVGVVGAF